MESCVVCFDDLAPELNGKTWIRCHTCQVRICLNCVLKMGLDPAYAQHEIETDRGMQRFDPICPCRHPLLKDDRGYMGVDIQTSWLLLPQKNWHFLFLFIATMAILTLQVLTFLGILYLKFMRNFQVGDSIRIVFVICSLGLAFVLNSLRQTIQNCGSKFGLPVFTAPQIEKQLRFFGASSIIEYILAMNDYFDGVLYFGMWLIPAMFIFVLGSVLFCVHFKFSQQQTSLFVSHLGWRALMRLSLSLFLGWYLLLIDMVFGVVQVYNLWPLLRSLRRLIYYEPQISITCTYFDAPLLPYQFDSMEDAQKEDTTISA